MSAYPRPLYANRVIRAEDLSGIGSLWRDKDFNRYAGEAMNPDRKAIDLPDCVYEARSVVPQELGDKRQRCPGCGKLGRFLKACNCDRVAKAREMLWVGRLLMGSDQPDMFADFIGGPGSNAMFIDASRPPEPPRKTDLELIIEKYAPAVEAMQREATNSMTLAELDELWAPTPIEYLLSKSRALRSEIARTVPRYNLVAVEHAMEMVLPLPEMV